MTFNSTTKWGWPAKTFHWIGAAIILVLLVHGWWMTHMTPRPDRLSNYAWHSALGYDLLALIMLRLMWRWLNPVPTLPADLKPWERLAAHAGHVSLYLLMFFVSLTGWMVATTFRVPMTKDLFGISVPPIVTTVDRSVRQWIEGSHMVLAYLLAAVVLIHIIGALRGHYLALSGECHGNLNRLVMRIKFSVHVACLTMSELSPLIPRKRPHCGHRGTSEKCQDRSLTSEGEGLNPARISVKSFAINSSCTH